MGKVAQDKTAVIRALPAACSDELKAVEFMERQRWGDAPECPRCKSADVYQMRSRNGERHTRYLWRCRGCAKQYTVRIGTVFEDSRIPLMHWCYGFWAACASKKGVSALQIKRQTGLSYKSALFMMHRIRYAMTPDKPEPLKGIVEVDETFVGGRGRRIQRQPEFKWLTPEARRAKYRRRVVEKVPVVALVERNGNVRTKVITDVTARSLKGAIHEHVDRSAAIHTDEHASYRGIGKHFAGGHHTVRHRVGEYVRGDVHINTAESFFGLLKRGLMGTFHAVSKKHLHRYVTEFEFRWNHRKEDDGARTTAAIRSAQGKRLFYRNPVKVPA